MKLDLAVIVALPVREAGAHRREERVIGALERPIEIPALELIEHGQHFLHRRDAFVDLGGGIFAQAGGPDLLSLLRSISPDPPEAKVLPVRQGCASKSLDSGPFCGAVAGT